MEIDKFVVFTVRNEEYAISIESILSIERMEQITPIPHLPSFVKGMTKIRGEIVPILDFQMILYRTPIEENEKVKNIVLKTKEMFIGVLVNEAREILEIPQDQIKQVGLVAYDETNYFTGVANVKERLITIIDPQKMIETLDGIKEIQEFLKSQKDE